MPSCKPMTSARWKVFFGACLALNAFATAWSATLFFDLKKNCVSHEILVTHEAKYISKDLEKGNLNLLISNLHYTVFYDTATRQWRHGNLDSDAPIADLIIRTDNSNNKIWVNNFDIVDLIEQRGDQ